MNPVVNIKKVTVPSKALEFFMLYYALEEPIFGSKGHIRLFQPLISKGSLAGLSVPEDEMSYLFDQFQQQDKITKSWIEYALNGFALKLALYHFSDELIELDPDKDWIYTNHQFLNEQERQMISSNANLMKLPKEIVVKLIDILNSP